MAMSAKHTEAQRRERRENRERIMSAIASGTPTERRHAAERRAQATPAAPGPKKWSQPLRVLVRQPVDVVDFAELERQIAIEARASSHGVTFTSGGRRYTFIWHRKGKRLLLSKRRRL